MDASKLTINIETKMSVDRSTAEMCLKVVELFVNSIGENVKAIKREDGTVVLAFAKE